jgi:NAD(P) transhydrogenase
MDDHFDLIVIGSGPAGESGAFEASRLGRSVALIDRRFELGGNCCHTGTLPSKTLRESSLALSHAIDSAFLPKVETREHPITMKDFTWRADEVMQRESARMRNFMERFHIAVFQGDATFVDDHTLQVTSPGKEPRRLHGDHILIAVGSRPVRPANVPFDGRRIFDSDELLALENLPKSLIILGAGVVGSEYATIFSNLGIPVQLVDAKAAHLPFVDQEIVAYLHREIVKRPLTLHFGTAISGIATTDSGAEVTLADGTVLRAEAALYCLGRGSNADRLAIDKAGITADKRATIAVDEHYRTNVAHIAAAGDVIGFPALAATSWDQGRSAVRAQFGQNGTLAQKLLPYGIYTIPEISTIGMNEAEAATAGFTPVVGRCEMGNTARGIISGDQGLLKLVIDRTSRALLGAHCLGARATDIIHIAMMCIRLKGTVDDLTEAVFNYPTVSDAIKVAALDATWQMEAQAKSGAA